MAFTLPCPGADEPESAWHDEVPVALGTLDTLAALDPRNPIKSSSRSGSSPPAPPP
jgi:hypothetical protein